MKTEILKYFAGIIEHEVGIVYSETNYFQLESRLESIASQLKVSSIEQLYEQARKGISLEFKRLLVEIATNNETSFFRDSKVYETLKDHLLPEILNRKNGTKLRFWSTACSFGQEPVSLAILLSELQTAKSPFDFEIFATDIANRAVQKTQSGLYSDTEIARGMLPNYLQKYFTKTADGHWLTNKEIRSRIQVRQDNLLNPFSPTGHFDLILCRNVLIYQRVENKSKIVQMLNGHLPPQGYLLLGAGESLIGISNEFERISINGVYLYQKK